MALSTDELIQKAVGSTTTTQLQLMIPQIWAARIENNLRKQAVFQQSVAINTDLLVPGAGDKVYLPTLPDLGAAVVLTEGTDMQITQLSTATSVALTPVEVGVSVEVTRKALDRIAYDGMAEVIDRLSYSMTLYIETAIGLLWNASVPGTANKMQTLYPNGHALSTVVVADTFSSALILLGLQKMFEANNVPFDDGYFLLYVAPSQYKQLLLDQDVRQDLRFGQPQAIFHNEVGLLHGCRVIVTNYCAQTTNEGAGTNVTVDKALLVAPRWAAIAYKRRPEIVVDPTVYDMGRRRRFGITADLDIELIHNDRGVVLNSAHS